MAESTWEEGLEEYCSQYARMILGAPAVPPPRSARLDTECVSWQSPGAATDKSRPTAAWHRRFAKHLIPRVVASDRFRLYRRITVDLAVLSGLCYLLSWLFPARTLGWATTPIYAVLVTLFAFTESLYQNTAKAPFASVVGAVARSVALALGLVLIALRGDLTFFASITTGTLSIMALVLLRRLPSSRWLRASRAGDSDRRHVLIVGANFTGRVIANVLRDDPEQGTVVRGFVDDNLPLSDKVLGRINDLAWLTRAEFVDEVIIALPRQPSRVVDAAEMAYRNHLDIRIVPDLPPGPWPTAGVEHIGRVPVVTLHREAVPSCALFLKRLIDVVGACLGLLVTGPVMAVIALLVRLDSRGPAVYAAERTGLKGTAFRCYKFRSMVAGADHLKQNLRQRNQRQGPIFKLDDDPRITRVGRWIRRYSLDELPQLWNVLLGDMSLVGPRPHPVDEVNHYELHQFRRLDVKPGITGLWQTTARDNPSFDLNMHLDLTYIENWSLFLDLRLLLKTVGVLFSPQGA